MLDYFFGARFHGPKSGHLHPPAPNHREGLLGRERRKVKRIIKRGEALNTEEAVVEAVMLFKEFWDLFTREESDLWEVFSDWAQGQWWFADHTSDYGAVWDTFIKYAFGDDLTQHYINRIIVRIQTGTELPDLEISDRDREYDGLCDEWDRTIVPMADDPETWRYPGHREEFYAKAKALRQQMADLFGLPVCQAGDCLKQIPHKRATRGGKYCSDKCYELEKARRSRKRNPQAKKKSDLKYLKFLEEEGDLD